ncbi:MAG: PASTA domain-containing protein [Clostridium sp.]|nr:PASTA domain-containing protein [Clostridium sp.]
MKDIDNLCLKCFEELTSGNVCEHCGYDNDSEANMMYLQPKTMLIDRYVVGAVLEHESDAVTYMAYDTQLDNVVTVREFLPKGIANRLEGNRDVHVRERYKSGFEKYKASFINLWTTIVKMHKLSAVITTYDVFELNGTAYAVSEYMESISLREFLIRNPEGNILWDRARLMFMPVLTTLEALHANGIVHGGISPDNLVLCRDGKIRLKGFCISEANSITSDLEFNVNEGYTALEQYENNHKMCPATDIYAFSACIFRALVGQNPPDAKSRETNDKLMIPNSIAENIPTYVIKALGGGLQIYPEKRTQSIAVFREQLSVTPSMVAAAQNQSREQQVEAQTEYEPIRRSAYEEKQPAETKGSKGKKVAVIVLVILIIAAAVAGAFVLKNKGLFNNGETTTAPVELQSYAVPNFINMGYTQSDVESNGAWNQQFKISFTEEYSTDAEAGVIFKQSVDAGSTVQEGTPIILTVSKGVETAQVPDVGGLPLESAKKQLEDAGFTVSIVEVYNDGAYEKDTVKRNYGMAPEAGATVAKGEEIILQVYGEVVTTTQPETTEAENPDENQNADTDDE